VLAAVIILPGSNNHLKYIEQGNERRNQRGADACSSLIDDISGVI
jgi:hypothetical protein